MGRFVSRNCVMLLGAWLSSCPVTAAELAIVVDDLGYSLPRGERVLALPGPVTVSVLPFAPATAAIVSRARQSGHEIILHQPMEALPASAAHILPGTLTMAMSADGLRMQMDAALAAVPGSVGLNNHTGSRLTQDSTAMRRLMRYLAGRDLLFLDSRTTPATVAYAMAREARVPAVQRDVFLDHVPEPQTMAAEFARALGIAERQGHAVIIAHPHDASLAFLERVLADPPPDLRLVSLRHLARRGGRAALARHESPTFPHRSPGQ